MSDLRRGWFWPQNSKKAHYFTTHDGYPRALCGGWALFARLISKLEDESHDSPDNCAKCKRERTKIYDDQLVPLPEGAAKP